MPLTLDQNYAKYQIQGYQPGKIQINNQLFITSMIVSAQRLESWPPQHFTDLNIDHFNQLSTWQPTILLIGTGTNLTFPRIELYGHLLNQHIGVEIMNTHSAVRTYNALTAEERNVVAALLIR